MNTAEFVKEFGEFCAEFKRSGIDATTEDVATLYAIYRKDLRADRFNNKKNGRKSDRAIENGNKSNEDPGKEPATERQKHYLMDLAYEKGLCITQKELDRMTREQASETIDTLLEGD